MRINFFFDWVLSCIKAAQSGHKIFKMDAYIPDSDILQLICPNIQEMEHEVTNDLTSLSKRFVVGAIGSM